MQNVVVRRPRKDEEEKLNQFFELVLKDTFTNNGIENLIDTLENEIKDKKRCLEEDFQSDGNARFFLVATIDDSIIGTIEHGPANDLINECTNGALSHLQEIGTLFVHPKFQKHGLGSLLLTKIFHALNNKNIEEFCFDSGYKIAQKIWRKKFGEPEYYLKNYWGDGEDHMIWRLRTIDVLR